jgi:drug/metabolite transporter (DMT)-like permease
MTAVGALLLITILSTVVAFALYFRFMESVSATNMSVTTYLNPVIAAVLGVLILGESFGLTTVIGTGLILLGAAVVNGLKIPGLGIKSVAVPQTAPVVC